MLTIAEGATSASFRVRADATTAMTGVTISGMYVVGASATASVVTTAPAPIVGDLAINEINYDVPQPTTMDGDANCNGVTEPGGGTATSNDEFVEIANVATHPVDLVGVTIWDTATFTSGMVRFSFGAVNLGPGESVLIFGGPVGTTGTSPWCTNLDGAHIGDALAFSVPTTVSQGLGLNNGSGTATADTVHLTATPLNTSTELVTAVAFPGGTDEAWVRNPDFTGAFVKHTTVPGHATPGNWTPGARVTGAAFSSANPP
jgi:hypothetical protein